MSFTPLKTIGAQYVKVDGSIVRNLFRGSARIISGPWAPDSPAYDASVTPLPFDSTGRRTRVLHSHGWIRNTKRPLLFPARQELRDAPPVNPQP